MTASFVTGSTGDAGPTGGTSLVVPRPGTPSNNDRLVCVIQVDLNVAIAVPSGWTALGQDTNGGVLRYFTRLSNGADPASWTFSWSGTEGATYAIGCWTGLTLPTVGWGSSFSGAAQGNNTTNPLTILGSSSHIMSQQGILLVPAYGGILGTGLTLSRDFNGIYTERLFRIAPGPNFQQWVSLGDVGESPYFSGPRTRCKTTISGTTATRVTGIINRDTGTPTPPAAGGVDEDVWAAA